MRRTFKYMIVIFVVIICTCLVSVWTSYFYMETTYFTYTSPKLTKEIRAVIISDLHNHEFGDGNAELITEVKENAPDIIFVLGDILNDFSESYQVTVDLTKELAESAPLYYALGNHEVNYMETHGEELKGSLETAGAKILELKYQDIEINGQPIRLGGLYDYAFALDGNNTTNPDNMDPAVYDFLTDFQQTDNLKLMLSHRPDSFIFGEAPQTWDIDLVISGHNHGGQVILPFLGGLYGGDQGWFPEYDYGLHSLEKYDILITRGLGSNPKPLPRFNNRPEVMVLTIKPENN